MTTTVAANTRLVNFGVDTAHCAETLTPTQMAAELALQLERLTDDGQPFDPAVRRSIAVHHCHGQHGQPCGFLIDSNGPQRTGASVIRQILDATPFPADAGEAR